jgi:hypothetical protein
VKPRPYKVDGGRATARLRHGTEETTVGRNTKAYWEVLAFAKEQPDSADFARDIVSALGLDGKTSAPPSPGLHIKSDGPKGSVVKPKAAKAPPTAREAGS